MTEPDVGYSKDQIAQAVLDTELDTTPANAVVIDAVARFRRQLDQHGHQGEMHDVFIVTSEARVAEHIARTIHAASEDDARQTHQENYADEPTWGSPVKPSARHPRRRATSHRSCA